MRKTMLQKKTKWYSIKSLLDANTTFHMLFSARKAGKSYSLQKKHS